MGQLVSDPCDISFGRGMELSESSPLARLVETHENRWGLEHLELHGHLSLFLGDLSSKVASRWPRRSLYVGGGLPGYGERKRA